MNEHAADDVVIETFPLGAQWPTLDPFLFCAHHDDAYPNGDGANAPAASLDGRDIGQDFSGKDGWSMYHGSSVPGFPQHPHRGFETVTFVRRGLVDHSDSMGAASRFGRGDVQWMTAGKGVVHCEMFPLVHDDRPNPLQLFQIWLNLPAADKMVDPYFTMLWDADIPQVDQVDGEGRTATATVIAGALGDAQPLPAPPNSWAARAEADVAIWHLRFDEGASFELPPAAEGSLRALYVFEGPQLAVNGTVLGSSTGAAVRSDTPVTLTAGDGAVEVMVLQGRPIGEPVAQYGPFVMNTQDEIMQAMRDYQATEFGGWPWPSTGPVHEPVTERFARHADGRVEDVVPTN